jgi:FMN-dependent NADH-azoreductase
MKTLLQINASLFGANGQSTRMAERFVAAWRDANPGSRLIVRDIGTNPVPHLDAARFGAFTAPADARTSEQEGFVAYSDALIDELKRADVIVLGLPMYNFALPSTLKAYFDQVARSGVTFRYTAKGPEGLLKGKKAYVFAARGGLYAGTPAENQTPYIRQILAFMGIDDVEFVYAEGLAISPARREQGIARANADIDRLLPEEELVAA